MALGHTIGGRQGPRLAPIAAAVAAGAMLVTAGAAAATPGKSHLVVYAVPSTAQFMNHADERLRGMSANPFTPNEQALVIVDNGTEKKNGPFPGDDVLYTFKLYPSAGLKRSTGTAMFTCYYTFFKRATCEAYFLVDGQELLADGRIAFGAGKFMLAVEGGTGTYLGARGQVTAEPAPSKASHAQRLEFAFGS